MTYASRRWHRSGRRALRSPTGTAASFAARCCAPCMAAVRAGGVRLRSRPSKASLDHQVYEAPELASWPRPAGAPVHATSVAPPQPHDGTDGEHSSPWTDGPGNPPAQAQRHATAPQPSEERVMVVESSCLQCSVPLRLRKGKVKIKVDSRAVEVTVDGRRHRFDALGERSGFRGFQIRGMGYVEISNLKLK